MTRHKAEIPDRWLVETKDPYFNICSAKVEALGGSFQQFAEFEILGLLINPSLNHVIKSIKEQRTVRCVCGENIIGKPFIDTVTDVRFLKSVFLVGGFAVDANRSDNHVRILRYDIEYLLMQTGFLFRKNTDLIISK